MASRTIAPHPAASRNCSKTPVTRSAASLSRSIDASCRAPNTPHICSPKAIASKSSTPSAGGEHWRLRSARGRSRQCERPRQDVSGRTCAVNAGCASPQEPTSAARGGVCDLPVADRASATCVHEQRTNAAGGPQGKRHGRRASRPRQDVSGRTCAVNAGCASPQGPTRAARSGACT